MNVTSAVNSHAPLGLEKRSFYVDHGRETACYVFRSLHGLQVCSCSKYNSKFQH